MLYNHELIRKLRFGAFTISALLSGYALISFIDHNLPIVRLVITVISLIVGTVCAWLMKKPTKPEFITYAASMLLAVAMLMFRLRSNIALDISLLGMIIGVCVSFATQLWKNNELA